MRSPPQPNDEGPMNFGPGVVLLLCESLMNFGFGAIPPQVYVEQKAPCR